MSSQLLDDLLLLLKRGGNTNDLFGKTTAKSLGYGLRIGLFRINSANFLMTLLSNRQWTVSLKGLVSGQRTILKTMVCSKEDERFLFLKVEG